MDEGCSFGETDLDTENVEGSSTHRTFTYPATEVHLIILKDYQWWDLHSKLVLCRLCRLGCPSVDIVGSFPPSLRIPGSQKNLHWLCNAFSCVSIVTQLSLSDCDLAPEGFHVVEAEQANVSKQRLKGVAPILLVRQALLDLEQSTSIYSLCKTLLFPS